MVDRIALRRHLSSVVNATDASQTTAGLSSSSSDDGLGATDVAALPSSAATVAIGTASPAPTSASELADNLILWATAGFALALLCVLAFGYLKQEAQLKIWKR